MNVLIGNAWPYANGVLAHRTYGRIAAGRRFGKVFSCQRRYAVFFCFRQRLPRVPAVAIRAKKENKNAAGISDYYHKEFTDCFFLRLGFSYDMYGKNIRRRSIKAFVTDFHKKLYDRRIRL
jgi:methionyl-tRNA synthetase